MTLLPTFAMSTVQDVAVSFVGFVARMMTLTFQVCMRSCAHVLWPCPVAMSFARDQLLAAHIVQDAFLHARTFLCREELRS